MEDQHPHEICVCGYPLTSVYSGRCPECGRNVPINTGAVIAQYREHRLDQRRTYYLYPGLIVIHGRSLYGRRFVIPVQLNGLDANIHTVWDRHPTLKYSILLFIFGAMIGGSVFVGDVRYNVVPAWMMWIAIAVSIVALVIALLSIRLVEFARFFVSGFSGNCRISIGCRGPDVHHFNDFVAQVRKAILATAA